MSEGEGDSPREPEDADSGDEIQSSNRNGNMVAEHGDVLSKLKMQVRDFKGLVSLFYIRRMPFCNTNCVLPL